MIVLWVRKSAHLTYVCFPVIHGKISPYRTNCYRIDPNMNLVEMPNANTALLSGFSEKLRPTLQLIQKNASGEVGSVLVQYVAAFVHPDFVCNLALLDALPEDAKVASLAFFEFCLTQGLSIEEQGALLAFVQPYIVATLGGPRPH